MLQLRLSWGIVVLRRTQFHRAGSLLLRRCLHKGSYMEDRRRVQRLKIEFPAVIQVVETKKNLKAATVDISAIGICFTSLEKVDVGVNLNMQITLPNANQSNIRTRVMWVQPMQVHNEKQYRTGVKILEPMQEDEHNFLKY